GRWHAVGCSFRNLSGMNQKLGHSKSNEVYEGVAGTWLQGLQREYGPKNVIAFREGGMMHFFVRPRKSARPLSELLPSLRAESAPVLHQYASVPSPKDATRTGIGLDFGSTRIRRNEAVDRVRGRVSREMRQRKAEELQTTSKRVRKRHVLKHRNAYIP